MWISEGGVGISRLLLRVTYQFRRDHRVYSDKQSSCMTFELSSEIAFCSMERAHGTSTRFDLLGCQQRRTT